MRVRAASAEVTGGTEVLPQITLESVPTAALIIDGSGRVLHANQRASLLLERHISLLRGMTAVELLGRDLLWTTSDSSALTVPVSMMLPSGRRLDVTASMSTLVDSSASPRTMVVLTTTSRRAGDPAGSAVPRVAPWGDVAEGVAALDCEVVCVAIGITGLQSINSSFSRSTGDAVLGQIATRLGALAGPGSLIERVSGNAFMVVMPVERASHRTIADLVSAVREPIETPLGHAAVGCSAGITTGPCRPPLVLLDRADRNLTVALGRGAGSIEWSDRARPPAVTAGARLGAPLVTGVANRAISTSFQPVFDLVSGDVVEYEALARWRDEQGASHLAAAFIPSAKETGIITNLGALVLESSLEFADQLCRRHRRAPRISINLASAELADITFAERVGSMLASVAVPPSMLQFELIDPITPFQAEYAHLNLRRLREIGVRFALDGFGSHATNLLTLRDLPVDLVKLDPTLIGDALPTSRATCVLRSVLGLAAQMGVDAVAKGVERIEQHEQLLRSGCRYAQGFLYSPALSVSELERGWDIPQLGASEASRAEQRRARIAAFIESGALDAANLAPLIRAVAQENRADMAAVAVIETGARWVAWEMSSWCDPRPPDIQPIVGAVCAEGPLEVDDTLEFGYTPEPAPGSMSIARSITAVPISSSDRTAIGVLCLLWLERGRVGGRPIDELMRTADHIATRIELAHARATHAIGP